YATHGSRRAREYWRVAIEGNDAVRFLREIGLASDTKHAAVEGAVANGHTQTWSARLDAVPSLQETVRMAKPGMLKQARQGLPTVALCKSNVTNDRSPSDLLDSVLQTFPELGAVGDTREVEESRLLLDAIAGITEGEEEEVYDICVPEGHSFISNGII